MLRFILVFDLTAIKPSRIACCTGVKSFHFRASISVCGQQITWEKNMLISSLPGVINACGIEIKGHEVVMQLQKHIIFLIIDFLLNKINVQ